MRKLEIEELERKTKEEFKDAAKTPVIIVLDNVRSLLNVGSIFRTADAFLIEAVYLCGITGTPPSREIEKTALGATETVDWLYFKSTAEAIEMLKKDGFSLWGIEQVENSQMLNELEISPNLKYALVLGNEAHGVSQDIINMCEGCIEIPQFGVKHSLNVSVSAGIVLWDFFKALRMGK
jgi:23S rRNA (guanosine2251-2'-O)-methyltransferase